MDTFPDLGSLSDQELKDLIQQLTDEEQEVSYRRRILHGKIDILRAELVNRLRKKHEGGEDVISGADVPILLDDAVEPGAYISGANRDNAHLRGVEPGRDFPFKRGDVRRVEPGDTVNGNPIRIEPAIEIGNIFKLGTRYSEPLGATYLDENGKTQLIWMGSYGLGPARIAAAAVEQYADENGISWPRAIAPFDVELVGLGREGSDERTIAEELYGALRAEGLDVLYDDRDAGPGEKFADAELLGVPVRVTVGRRTLADGEVEVQVRRGREARTVPLDGAAQAVADLWQTVP